MKTTYEPKDGPADTIEMYEPHEGTLRISGKSEAKKVGIRAYNYLVEGKKQIDFWAIGGSANNQAMKGMGVFLYMVEHERSHVGVSIAFQPRRFKTVTTHPETGEKTVKDCVVWRTIIINAPSESQAP